MKIRKYSAWIGLSEKISTAEGIAPIKGPKKGIRLVTPTSAAISSGYGHWKSVITTKVMIPTTAESMTFPETNPLKTRSTNRKPSSTTLAVSLENREYSSFLD